ncbi:hypothetical protein V6N12_065392 [Hibiscus sabdariffa]|uniref:Uncharacterized protein n=1 Tax=Hibiscus sabdariffa TaxID=183260 RepID=A0ABR2G9L3_9ROSI
MDRSTSVKLGIGRGELGNCLEKEEARARDGKYLEMGSGLQGQVSAEEWDFLKVMVDECEAKRGVGLGDGYLGQFKLEIYSPYPGTAYLTLVSVDAYGHLVVSKLHASGKDVDKSTYSVLARDFGVGEDLGIHLH